MQIKIPFLILISNLNTKPTYRPIQIGFIALASFKRFWHHHWFTLSCGQWEWREFKLIITTFFPHDNEVRCQLVFYSVDIQPTSITLQPHQNHGQQPTAAFWWLCCSAVSQSVIWLKLKAKEVPIAHPLMLEYGKQASGMFSVADFPGVPVHLVRHIST